MESPSSVSSTFFSAPSRKRFHEATEAPHLPIIGLDREGTIQSMTPAARQVLEYTADEQIDPCFFSHVHANNHHRVMQDLAHIVARGKQQTRWLLRLHTGNKRWRWYRALVRNELSGEAGCIQVRLRPL